MDRIPVPYRGAPPDHDAMTCPRCRSTRGFHAVSLQEDGSAGCLMLFLGGIIPYLIYSSRNSNLLECENCQLVFRPPRRPARWESIIALAILAAVVGLILYIVYAAGSS